MSHRCFVWTLAAFAMVLVLVPFLGMFGVMSAGWMMGGGMMVGMSVIGLLWVLLAIIVMAALVLLLLREPGKV